MISNDQKLHYKVVIVGAGFAGAVLAERFASQLKIPVLLIDRREHIGGNSYDFHDEHGILLHRYGPHYFRTNSEAVIDYLSQFTEWHPTEYHILSWTDGQYWPFPINLNTFEQFIGRSSTTEEMQATLDQWKVPIANPKNSEEMIISQVGYKLYEMFFKNYTKKQWQRDPSELDASVCGRIPIRTNRDNRYLSERFQALPKEGYTALFKRLLNNPLIDVQLGVDFQKIKDRLEYDLMIYTGQIDEFYQNRFGLLPYRSLRFEFSTQKKEYFQPAVQVNFPNDFDYTRIVELKHITGQKSPVTTIVKEYPQNFTPDVEAYYPMPTLEARHLYEKYQDVAMKESKVIFIGRLANYQYYNMDQIIMRALRQFDALKNTISH